LDNASERQIRRIAKYRNNSYFVGSPEAGVRFARLMLISFCQHPQAQLGSSRVSLRCVPQNQEHCKGQVGGFAGS